MYKLIVAIFVSLIFSLALSAQTAKQPDQGKPVASRGPVFRANKEQIAKVQKTLGVTESGKLDEDTREAVKGYQSRNGLRATGTLNRATLEKMGVTLTDAQMTIPISANSFPKSTGEARRRGPVFRATRDQISLVQKTLKTRGLLNGNESGRLDEETRAAVRAYQESAGLKATGTLNPATLEKMGIPLNDRQKALYIGGPK